MSVTSIAAATVFEVEAAAAASHTLGELQSADSGRRRELLVQHAAQLVPRDAKISRLARLAAKGDAKVAEHGTRLVEDPMAVGHAARVDLPHRLLQPHR